MGLGGWFDAATDLLLGASCPGCDTPGWGLCPDCRRALSGQAFLTRPDPPPAGFPLTATGGLYQPTMRRLISAHKEEQVLTLTAFLGQRLAVAVTRLVDERATDPRVRLVLVPVPSTPSAVRARGFDATWAMARLAARVAAGDGRTVSARRLLGYARRVQDQTGLDAGGRRDNLAGSLRVTGRSPPGSAVVVVDDLVTTGSSLAEAARALRTARIPVLGAATVAATVRSRSSGRSGSRPA